MRKRQLIEAIRAINATASPEFLARFDEDALQQYLTNLQNASRRNVRIAGWIKRSPGLRMAS